MRRHRRAEVDEFVACRHHRDLREYRNRQVRASARRRHGNLAAGEFQARAQHLGTGRMIAPAAMQRMTRTEPAQRLFRDRDAVVRTHGVFVRHHTIGVHRQHGAGHHLDATVGRATQFLRDHSGSLSSFDAKRANPLRQRRGAKRKTVHGHPVKRRKVPIGPHRRPQDAPVGVGQRTVFARERRDLLEDEFLGFGRG